MFNVTRLLAQKGAAVAGPLMCDCDPITHQRWVGPGEWGLYLVTTDFSFFQFRGDFETGLLHHECALLFHGLPPSYTKFLCKASSWGMAWSRLQSTALLGMVEGHLWDISKTSLSQPLTTDELNTPQGVLKALKSLQISAYSVQIEHLFNNVRYSFS